MEIKAELKQPYTDKQRMDFIVEQNHKLGYEIRQVETTYEVEEEVPYTEIVTEEIQVPVFDEEGNLQFRTQQKEGDLLYDEIGSVLKIKQLQNTKQDLLESLEMYYRVFFLGEDE